MRQDARRVLIAYDIPDDKRRSRIAHTLEAYGDRVQYSVFIVQISPVRIARLRRALAALLVHGDAVLICDLGRADSPGDRIEFLGQRPDAATPRNFVV